MVSVPQTTYLAKMYPEGFHYFEEIVSPQQESALLEFARSLPFKPYVMRGQASRRGIMRFGHDYGAVGGDHHEVQPIPGPLIQLRSQCAKLSGINEQEFVAALVTHYPPGATIGWHSDMTMFGPVVFGVSLLAPCTFKLRHKQDAKKVYKIALPPGSLYVMEGEVRFNWEHSIPPVRFERYSITYRALAEPAGRDARPPVGWITA